MKVSTSLQQVNNNLTEAQQLRAEKEKARQLEAEYQRQLKKVLIDKMIVFINGEDLSAIKLNIINNKYEIIEQAANEIYNMTEKKEVLNRTSDDKITDTIIINKYNKSYIDISDDLSGLFYKILNDLLKDETEKEKAEKAREKQEKEEKQTLLYNYLEALIQGEGLQKLDISIMNLQREKLKRMIAEELEREYNQEFLKMYNKTIKELKANYQTEADILKAENQTKNKPLSIWWKLAAITSLLNKKH